MNLCACGCGSLVEGRYRHGHNSKGPWNRGLTKETDPRMAKISQKVSLSLTGKTRPIEVIEKQRASIMGKNKGHKFGEDFRLMRREMMLGTHHSPASNEKRSQSLKKKIAAGEWFPTLPSNPFPKPNSKELKLLSILEQHFPGQYAYTGDGKVVIDHLVPDFTNCNGHKEVIELYGDYWHRGEDEMKKLERYAKFGFACLVVWECELKTQAALVDKIRAFRRR